MMKGLQDTNLRFCNMLLRKTDGSTATLLQQKNMNDKRDLTVIDFVMEYRI